MSEIPWSGCSFLEPSILGTILLRLGVIWPLCPLTSGAIPFSFDAILPTEYEVINGFIFIFFGGVGVGLDRRVGKLILFGAIFRCVDSALTIAACLSYKSPFTSPWKQRDEAQRKKLEWSVSQSDHLTVLKVFKVSHAKKLTGLGPLDSFLLAQQAWQEACRRSKKAGYQFAEENFLSVKTLEMLCSLKQQFVELLSSIGFLPSGLSRVTLQRAARDSTDGVLQATGPKVHSLLNYLHTIEYIEVQALKQYPQKMLKINLGVWVFLYLFQVAEDFSIIVPYCVHWSTGQFQNVPSEALYSISNEHEFRWGFNKVATVPADEREWRQSCVAVIRTVCLIVSASGARPATGSPLQPVHGRRCAGHAARPTAAVRDEKRRHRVDPPVVRPVLARKLRVAVHRLPREDEDVAHLHPRVFHGARLPTDPLRWQRDPRRTAPWHLRAGHGRRLDQIRL